MNPKVKDFLEEYPNLTLIGLFWAGWWRLYLYVLAICILFTMAATILEAIFS